MDRQKQLDEFIEALENLITVLKHDKDCEWTQHFENRLHEARDLRDDGFEQKDLNLLSASAMSVYGGMGSFNDYAPILYSEKTGRSV